MKEVELKNLHYSPEVLERLPYWVREVLRMMGKIEASKKRDVHKKP